MSKKEDTLLNKHVTVYLDGGWQISGKVESLTEKKLVLRQSESNDLILVFRDKVSCLSVRSEPTREAVTPPVVKREVGTDEVGPFPMNDVGYLDSGMSIPRAMLENLPEIEDEDFSVSFGDEDTKEGSLDPRKGKIEFRIDDDS
jgi:sRNA-binding regulator protein Hfq|tara:strand:- start:3498 stop:3929 length:432 start_codon:yes stop_codon:yes gene_type:complete